MIKIWSSSDIIQEKKWDPKLLFFHSGLSLALPFLIQYSIYLPDKVEITKIYQCLKYMKLIFELRWFTIIENQCVNFIYHFILNFMWR